MNNLIALANSKLYAKYPNTILDRNLLTNCPQLSMFTRGNDLIQIDRNYDLVITSKQPLPAVASSAQIEQTRDHTFVDMYPIFPTIDLKEEHVYDVTRSHVTGVYGDARSNHVHTFVHLNDDQDAAEFTSEQDLTRLIMFAFGTAYGQFLSQV